MQQNQYKNVDIKWLLLEPQWVKIKIDEVVKTSSSLVGCGGLIRNYQGG